MEDTFASNEREDRDDVSKKEKKEVDLLDNFTGFP